MKQCDANNVEKQLCKAYDYGACRAPETCRRQEERIKEEEKYGPGGPREAFGHGEKDPNGIQQHEHGAKTDSGKPDCSLLLMFGRALSAVAEVGTYGAVKYTRGGWQGVSSGVDRYTAALLRHLFREHYEEYDKDLPVRHAAQVAWNALARLELMIREAEDEKINPSGSSCVVRGGSHSSNSS